MGKILKTYSELMRLSTYEERLAYLVMHGTVGSDTFGYDRYINQWLYRSSRWHDSRKQVILRDSACDLALRDRPIMNRVIVHHMNPITLDDIMTNSELVLNPEYLICVTRETHDAIHYSAKVHELPPERYSGDTVPWRVTANGR